MACRRGIRIRPWRRWTRRFPSAGRCGPATSRRAVSSLRPATWHRASRGISHSCQFFLSAAFSFSRKRLQLRLPLVPDDIDLRVVGDGFERDVRHALIDEAVADVPVHGLRTRRGAGDFGFLDLAFAGIGQQVKRIARAHDAGAGQRQRHARGVNRDPAAAPLLGDGTQWCRNRKSDRARGRQGRWS